MDALLKEIGERRGRQLGEMLKEQERYRALYWQEKDYFLPQRLEWRARMTRHLFHLFPDESILEIGCSKGQWSIKISESNGHANKICAATFDPSDYEKMSGGGVPDNIEPVLLEAFPGKLVDRRFDYIVGWNLLTDDNCGPLLLEVKKLLKPGGRLLFFDVNPWNPYYIIRRFLARVVSFVMKKREESDSLNRIDLFTILSEVGYTRIKALPYDFVYPPIPRFFLWLLQNLSLILENFPFIRNFAGSLYIFAQKPPVEGTKIKMPNLARHEIFKGKVSVVVPCRNEEDNIPSLVENLLVCYGDYIHEIILVDDNSRDKTAEIATILGEKDNRVRLIRREMPNGVGRALRDGYDAVTGEFVLTMDCDFQHILPEFTGLFDAVQKGADMAIGSRFSRDSVLLNYAFTKILANRGFHIIANLLLGKHFRDATNNLKFMKREVLDSIHLESHDFAANAETGLQPILLGYNVKEVPVSWINRSVDMGFSSFNLFKTGPNYLRVLVRLIGRKWRGKEITLPKNKIK
jgi:dolichol-phosphate mannosyltransferase